MHADSFPVLLGKTFFDISPRQNTCYKTINHVPHTLLQEMYQTCICTETLMTNIGTFMALLNQQHFNKHGGSSINVKTHNHVQQIY